MKYRIFWCKVNKYYLNKWLWFFQEQWFSDKDFLVATCVVTDRAKTKWLREIKKLLNQWWKVYLTWCWVFEKWDVFAQQEFYNIYSELLEYKDNIVLLPQSPKQNFNFEDVNIYTKKFIVIQNWCDTNCTFCLSIKKRWPSQSIDQNSIISQINDFEKNWWKEIVLTWINMAAYWVDNTRKPQTTKFAELLETVLQQTKIPRIRLSSLGPEFLNDKFFKVIQDNRFLPHFHISIQSFSDDVLKSMNRNYTSKTLEDVLTKFRNLDRKDKDYISLWADIIVWFPWESEKNFQQTLEWVCNFNITKLHIFPFSAHKKYERIPASAFPNQVDRLQKKQRENELILLWDKIRQDFISANKGKEWEVLLEEKKGDCRYGWTGNYIQVCVKWNHHRWELVKITL